MKWLRVANWESWQTYRKDRGPPPWIKVHRRVLQNVDWAMLTDADKGALVSIWILAADKDGIVPNDSAALQRILGLGEPPNLSKFIELGFLESDGRHDDAKVTPMRRHGGA